MLRPLIPIVSPPVKSSLPSFFMSFIFLLWDTTSFTKKRAINKQTGEAVRSVTLQIYIHYSSCKNGNDKPAARSCSSPGDRSWCPSDSGLSPSADWSECWWPLPPSAGSPAALLEGPERSAPRGGQTCAPLTEEGHWPLLQVDVRESESLLFFCWQHPVRHQMKYFRNNLKILKF